MTDIGEITVKELTEYADYCMGKIPIEERVDFPNTGRVAVNEVRRDTRDGAEYPVIDTGLVPEDMSFYRIHIRFRASPDNVCQDMAEHRAYLFAGVEQRQDII